MFFFKFYPHLATYKLDTKIYGKLYHLTINNEMYNNIFELAYYMQQLRSTFMIQFK